MAISISLVRQRWKSREDAVRKETIDIEDVEFDEVDLEFDALFPDNEVECTKADKSGNEYYDKIS